MGRFNILDRVVRGCISDKVIFEQQPEGSGRRKLTAVEEGHPRQRGTPYEGFEEEGAWCICRPQESLCLRLRL